MKLTPSTTYQKALALGAIAGMRAMTAPAILSHHYANSNSFFLDGSSFGYLQKSGFATGMKVLAAAEFIGDKLPFTPKRIKPMQLLPRAFSGALVGATIAEANGESRITGGLYGLVGAMAASYAFYYVRKKLGKVSGLPDGVFALMEDALALKVGTAIMKD